MRQIDQRPYVTRCSWCNLQASTRSWWAYQWNRLMMRSHMQQRHGVGS